MKFPGGFLEVSDFIPVRGNWVRYKPFPDYENSYFDLTFSNEGDVSRIQRMGMPHPGGIIPDRLFHWSRPYLNDNLYLENFITIRNQGANWIQATEENVLARLQSPWAKYSLATVDLVNKYLSANFTKLKDRREYLKNHSDIKWSRCSYTKLLVPTKLKKLTYVNGEYKPAYYMLSQARDLIDWNNKLERRVQEYLETRAADLRAAPSRSRLLGYSERATSYLPYKKDLKDKSNMYYGVELEYEERTDENTCKTIDLLKDHAILKRDGSVTTGFEICTAPAMFSVHAEAFKQFFEYLPSSGLRSMSNTGMHVHMSKEPMSFLQLGKIFAFMNNDINDGLITRIAGRPANSYCRKNTVENPISLPLRNENGVDRYSRVNLGNSATMEIRIFSTPTTYEEFMYKLEFCKALFEFTSRAADTPAKKLQDFSSGDVFKTFVLQNQKSYKHLAKFIGA